MPQLFTTIPVRLGLACIALSSTVYLLLLAGLARPEVLQALSAAAIATVLWGAWRDLPRMHWTWWGLIAGLYFVIYAYHATGPEIQSDAMGYQLSLPREYLSLGRFATRVGFYEVLPQGLGMLYTAALAWGSPIAVKLVHFSLLLATPLLMMRIGALLRLPVYASIAAALLYFTSPVAGVTGTCAYVDAGQVFFLVLAVCFMLEDRPAFAGLAAGFCYAVKSPGLIAVPLLLLVYAWRRDWRGGGWFVGGAALTVLPWMIRAVVMAQNPFAPMLSTVFKNRWFWVSSEQFLSAWLRSYDSTSGLIDIFVGGRQLQGLVGPAFLLAPLAVFSRRGRWALAAGVAFFTPWLLNHGARFAMLALPFLAFAIALALPRRLVWAVVTLEAALCLPWALPHWADPHGWYLDVRRYPLTGLPEYRVARQVDQFTEPGARILFFEGIAPLYSARDTQSSWNTVDGRRIYENLILAMNPTLFEYRAAWPERSLLGLRLELKSDLTTEWQVQELRLPGVTGGVTPDADPNPWETPRMLDRKLVTRWSTRELGRNGAWVSVEFDKPNRIKEVSFVSPQGRAFVEVQGLTSSGWKRLAGPADKFVAPELNYRSAAVKEMKAAGYTHLLVKQDQIGKAIAANPMEWSLELAAPVEDCYLFRLL